MSEKLPPGHIPHVEYTYGRASRSTAEIRRRHQQVLKSYAAWLALNDKSAPGQNRERQ